MSGIIQQVQASESDKIKRVNTVLVAQMKAAAKQSFNLLWANKNKTAQEICDELGTSAALAFQAHGDLQDLIYLVDPSWQMLIPPLPFTINQDGTVTIDEG